MKPALSLLKSDLTQVFNGFLMGGANIIPGVSGGTVALILGIYQRVVVAISRVDLTLLGHVRQHEWRRAIEYLDARFLAGLGIGTVLGVLSLASLMHYLLEEQQMATYSVFFGLILASSVLVARLVRQWRASSIVFLVGACLTAFIVVELPALKSPPAGHGYIFACGVISICTMILPGISGSFILLIMGKYQLITGILRDLMEGEVHMTGLVTLAVFAAGCLIGLLGFAKLLRWLFSRYEYQTLAFLCGLMLGSLRKLWPFESGWPQQFDSQVALSVTLVVLGAASIFLLDFFSRHGNPHSTAETLGPNHDETTHPEVALKDS